FTFMHLIAYLMVCSKPGLHKYFSTAVRELSVFFKQGDGQWRKRRSVLGAAMKDARIARRINGLRYGMVVASAGKLTARACQLSRYFLVSSNNFFDRFWFGPFF